MADIPVPQGLHDLLQAFVVNVLRHQPSDLVEYASRYFGELLDSRDQGRNTAGGELLRPTLDDEKNVSSSDNDDFMDEAEELAMMSRRMQASRRKSVCGERVNLDDSDTEEERIVHPKTDEQRKRLAKVVADLLIFSSLDEDQLQFILDAMFERHVTAGEHVIDEGDDGDNFYVVERGDYDIFINDPVSKTPVHKGTYAGAGSFGELALMYNCPRAATIIATTDGSLWAMDRSTFCKIIVKNAARKRKQYEDFLATVPLLSTLTIEERSKVADAMTTRSFNDGDVILRQGERPDYFYMIVSGNVIVKRRGDDPAAADREVMLKRYNPGEYFGELALITNQPRAATAVADGSCSCAVLDVQAFERLLGPCKELLARNIPLYEQQLSQITNELSVQDD